MNWILVAISLGAVLGALARYYITLFWLEKQGNKFPYGTFFVNITGAFLIGVASILTINDSIPVAFQKMIIVGFLGAYTTFSSYILDTANLFRGQRISTGLFYWIGSPVLGFISVELGIWTARHFG